MPKSFIALFATLALSASTGVVMAQTTSGPDAKDRDFIEGEIVRINRKERTITVRDDRDRQVRQFAIPQGTRVSVEGRTADFRDLRRGDGIVLTFRAAAQTPVVTRVQIPETPVGLEQRRAQPAVAETMPTSLPGTASVWPLVWLCSLAALFAGFGLRRVRKAL